MYFDITGNKLNYAEYERDIMSNDDDFYNRDESGDKRDWDCFTIHFPITVTLSDGYTYNFDSEESVKEYYDTYEIDGEINIAFPITVTDKDGEAIVIESDESLEEVYRGCYNHERDIVIEQKCFSLVYPVFYQLPDGSLIEVLADDEDSWAEMNAWYDENPESSIRPTNLADLASLPRSLGVELIAARFRIRDIILVLAFSKLVLGIVVSY